MSDGMIAPVIAGLAVGIAFIAAFSLLPSPLQSAADSIQDSSQQQLPHFVGQEGGGQVIFVDFAVALAEQDIFVKRGELVNVPISIESEKETEKVLSLSIMARDEVPDSGELELSLDKDSVVLSPNDIAQDNGSGRLTRDVGFLVVSASPTAKAGTYEYLLEANYEGVVGGVGMGSGQAFRVTVVE